MPIGSATQSAIQGEGCLSGFHDVSGVKSGELGMAPKCKRMCTGLVWPPNNIDQGPAQMVGIQRTGEEPVIPHVSAAPVGGNAGNHNPCISQHVLTLTVCRRFRNRK
jgi:hypothetical protein